MDVFVELLPDLALARQAQNEQVSENLSAAQSNIQDVDMASEETEFTKDQILEQSGISMLSQAEQNPQAVLKLLGG